MLQSEQNNFELFCATSTFNNDSHETGVAHSTTILINLKKIVDRSFCNQFLLFLNIGRHKYKTLVFIFVLFLVIKIQILLNFHKYSDIVLINQAQS